MRPVPMIPTRMVMRCAPGVTGRCPRSMVARSAERPAGTEAARREVALRANRNRQWPVELAGIHVLLNDAEQVTVQSGQCIDDRRHVRLAEWRLDHCPETDRRREAQALFPDASADCGVDLLEV